MVLNSSRTANAPLNIFSTPQPRLFLISIRLNLRPQLMQQELHNIADTPGCELGRALEEGADFAPPIPYSAALKAAGSRPIPMPR